MTLGLVFLTGCRNNASDATGERSGGQAEPSVSAPGDATRPPSPAVPETATPAPIPTETPTVARSGRLPECEALEDESHYCLTMTGGEIQVLGLDSGSLCPVAATDAPVDTFLTSASIAWLEDHLYVCGASGVIRIALRDGSWEAAGRPCDAVAAYGGGLLVNRWRVRLSGSEPGPAFAPPLEWYPDYEAVRHDQPARTFALGDFTATMTVQGSTLYTAWHAGMSVAVGDLIDDRPLGVLTLEDFNGWMLGMSVTDDGYLALISREGVLVFDAYDGRRVKRLDASVSSLACLAGRAVTPRDTPTSTPTATPSPEIDPTATPCWSFDCPDACADLASDPSPFRLYELAPSIPTASCLGGYGSSNYVLPEERLVPGATEELHVIGVYEARGNPGFRPFEQGVVDVVVHQRPRPVVLALSAHGGMLWRVSLDPGARLARVILQGLGPQEVEGIPPGVPVEYRGPGQACGYASGWEVANNSGGGEYELMIKSLRRFTGLIETSFQGCSEGDKFEIPHWSGSPPILTRTPVPGDETMRREQVSFPGCESVTAEQSYCLTTTYDSIALLGLDRGTVCPLTRTSAGLGSAANTIAWRGELLYACGESGLVRVSVRDGRWEAAQVACSGVTDYAGGLLVAGSIADPVGWLDSALHAYPDYAAVLRGEPSQAFDVGDGAFAFTVDGDTLYSAWHSTNTIDTADLATNEARSPILLDGYDGWILGLSITDGQLVVSGDTWGDTVRIFDAATGDHLRDIDPTVPVSGLSCVTRGQ